MKIGIIVLGQNVYFNCTFFRAISLNATRIVLFRMRDLKQIALKKPKAEKRADP